MPFFSFEFEKGKGTIYNWGAEMIKVHDTNVGKCHEIYYFIKYMCINKKQTKQMYSELYIISSTRVLVETFNLKKYLAAQ